MCCCDDNSPEFCNSVTRKARKDHRCSECRRAIMAGETYEEHSGKWDGGMETFRWCAHCAAAREILDREINDAAREAWKNSAPDRKRWGFENPLCFCFAGLWEAVDDLRGHPGLEDTRAGRLLVGARRKWKHKRGPMAGQLMPVPAVQAAVACRSSSSQRGDIPWPQNDTTPRARTTTSCSGP